MSPSSIQLMSTTSCAMNRWAASERRRKRDLRLELAPDDLAGDAQKLIELALAGAERVGTGRAAGRPAVVVQVAEQTDHAPARLGAVVVLRHRIRTCSPSPACGEDVASLSRRERLGVGGASRRANRPRIGCSSAA